MRRVPVHLAKLAVNHCVVQRAHESAIDDENDLIVAPDHFIAGPWLSNDQVHRVPITRNQFDGFLRRDVPHAEKNILFIGH